MTFREQRLRILFSKGENLRFISHLDLARTWERVLRRAGIPLAYSQGYHPHPKMVFAAALPVGCTGDAEVMDVVLSEAMPPRRVLRGLASLLPEGLGVADATPVYMRAPSLPTLLYGADYDILVETDEAWEDAAQCCEALLARDTIPRVHRGKSYDLRPLIDDLDVVNVNSRYVLIRMQLAAGERGTGRPSEVLDEMGWGDHVHHCHRRQMRFAPDGDAQG